MRTLRYSIPVWLLLLVTISAWGQGRNKRARGRSGAEVVTDRVVVRNLSAINTPYYEFSPTYYQNGIVFVSSRQRGGLIDPKLGEPYFELFYAKLDREGIPYQPRLFSLEINAKYHEGPVTFTGDAEKMYFSRNNFEDGYFSTDEQGVSRMQIFQAQRGELDWENIQLMPFNDPEYKSMHPTVTEDGMRLYFTSDRPGGFGGMDIYVTEKVDGAWLDPINLGPDVNTTGNEVFPFIHPSGILFFASDGHGGLGGLDLFLIDISERQWGELVNMGPPFNSDQDDFGFTLNASGTQGIFSSNREGGLGKDDLYGLTTPDGMEGIKVATRVMARIQITDRETQRPVVGAQIRLFEQAADGSTKGGQIYDVELLPSDSTGAIKLVERRRPEPELGEPVALIDRQGFAVLPLDPRSQYTLLVDQEGYKSVEQTLKLSPTESVQDLHIELEKRRCVTLTGTVRSKGYNKPIPNAEIKISSDCGTGLDLIRTNADGKFEYCLEMACQFGIYAEKTGFATAEKKLSTVSLRGARSFDVNFVLEPDRSTRPKNVLKAGMVILLESIVYDFNKSAIRKGATRDLEALARLMLEYPSMQIEIGAHTDSRGTSEYNKSLSEARALYAKDFLLQNGVASRRIQTKGYGETRLRNHCNDGAVCSESEHSYNRRIEIKILRVNEVVDLNRFNAALNQ